MTVDKFKKGRWENGESTLDLMQWAAVERKQLASGGK
jgi:hypothetical protein